MSKFDLRNELINELFLTAIGYHMVLLTGYVVRPKQKLEIGKILLQLVYAKLGYNGLMLFVSLKNSIFEYKNKFKRKLQIQRALDRSVIMRHKQWRVKVKGREDSIPHGVDPIEESIVAHEFCGEESSSSSCLE